MGQSIVSVVFMIFILLQSLVNVKSITNFPNIIFFLVDDLGVSDIGYTSIGNVISFTS